MPFKKVEMTLKLPKCLHLEKLLLAYVIVLLMSYNLLRKSYSTIEPDGIAES